MPTVFMKIDLHTHILPRDWPDLDAKYGYSGFVRLDHYEPCCARMMIGDRVFREITDNVWDPKRRVRELGLRGAQIGTHVDANPHSGRIDALNLDNASLQPVWSAAEQLGAAIFVHPWDMLGKERMPKYWLPWLVGMPAEASLAICSMIFGGVFERFPKLRVAFAHGGGAFPFTIGRIEHAFHVRPDLYDTDNNTNA